MTFERQRQRCSTEAIAAGTPKKLTRKERKAATREHLKEVARQCFIDRGFTETTVGHVASGAGVAHGTFYVHFSSKEEVLDELLREFSSGIAQQLLPHVKLQDELEPMVTAVAGVFLDSLESESALLRAFVQRAIQTLSLAELRDGVSPPLTQLLSSALGEIVSVGLQYVYNDEVDRQQAIEALTKLSIGSFDAMFPP
jgi:AcrR family transcriptional regulator